MSLARKIGALFGTTTTIDPANGGIPSGALLPFAGSTAPSGWLLCYGQSLLRSSYPALFAAIGTTYGAADGTHFNVPDLRGRVPGGKDDMGGSAASRLTSGGSGVDGATLGASGGAETHTLTSGQIPAHTHTNNYDGTSGANTAANRLMTTSGTNGAGTWTSGSAGGGGAHNNAQPTLVLNYLIKT